MKSTRIVVALAILVSLIGCGPERTKTVPDELIGTWKTSAAKYADTFIELTRTTITFGAGEAGSHIRSVVAVEKVREDGNTLYTVLYKDPEGQEYKPQSEIINRQGAKNAKTRRPYWGRQTELLKASRTGSRVLDWKVPNVPSMAALASWRFKVFLGSGQIGLLLRSGV